MYDVYAEAYYFMSTTMSCIGYGDITPKNEIEKLFVIFCQLVGLFCFGRIQYTAKNLLFHKRTETREIEEKQKIEDWL